ncbi:MAG: DUF3011 domain-containing protein [Iphinoe sp. HA4291-MV1]|nr:DUF3011 domain-containing protein [Iphinoe sp. HA4291-MV1]
MFNMIVRFPTIAATLMATTVSLGTLFNFAQPASAREIITCESRGNERNTCSIDGRGRVRFVRQLSDASCRGNWGYNRNRIWVRDGCRAEFAVSDRTDDRYDRRYDRRSDEYDRDDRIYDRRSDEYDRNDRIYVDF